MPQALQEEQPECGALFQEDGRVRWRVWAPKAKRVELVLIDGESRTVRPMEQEEHGYFSFMGDRGLSGQR